MKKKKNLFRGDKLRELIFFVYLNEKYGTGETQISRLKRSLGYSTGGIYNAIDDSGYFQRSGDIIRLTENGSKYVKEKILTQYSALNPFCYLFILLGANIIFFWILKNFMNISVVFEWYQGVALIIGGLIIRFLKFRLTHLILKLRKMI